MINNMNFYYNKKIYDDYNCFLKKCTAINSNGVHHFIKSIHSNSQYCKYCGCSFFKNPLESFVSSRDQLK